MGELGKLGGLVVGAAFAIGVLYNFGYFLALDLHWFTLLTYKDHLETLVFFGPFVLAAAFYFLGERRTPRRRRVLTLAIGTAGALACGIWIVRAQWGLSPEGLILLSWAMTGLSFLVVAYATAVMFDKALDTTEPIQGSRATAVTPPALALLVFLMLLGNARAHLATGAPDFDMQVTMKPDKDEKATPRAAEIVRIIDNGLLIILADAPDRLVYVRNEEVKAIGEALQR